MTFLLLFSLTSYTSKCIWQPFSEHRATCLREKPVQGMDVHSKPEDPSSLQRGSQRDGRGHASEMSLNGQPVEKRKMLTFQCGAGGWTLRRAGQLDSVQGGAVWLFGRGSEVRKACCSLTTSRLATHCPGAFPAATGPSPQMHSQLEKFP